MSEFSYFIGNSRFSWINTYICNKKGIFKVKHDVYISYSMDNSGKAYELSGKLSLLHISYHLDCVESGFGLNGYTRGVIDDCRVYVALVGSK